MSDANTGSTPRISRRELRRRAEQLAATPVLTPEAAPAPGAATGALATILTVCTGNICRSPMAEVLLRHRLEGLPIRVHSGGTQALVGYEMPEQAVQLAVAQGVAPGDAAQHRARYLAESMLEESDLVLTMAREHRTHAVQLSPASLRRAFTLREFARLGAGMTDAQVHAVADAAGADPGERLRALAGAVGERRGLTPPVAGEDDDVIDPYRRSQRTYELSASQLVPAVETVARLVRATIG